MIDAYLENIIRELDTTSIRLQTNDMRLPLDFLHYMWQLSYRPGSQPNVETICIDKSELLKWLGGTMEGLLDRHLRQEELGNYVHLQICVDEITRREYSCYCISPDDLGKVQKILDKHYGITSSIPHLGMPGYRYVRQINTPDIHLRDGIGYALLSLLNDDENNPFVRIDPLDASTLRLQHVNNLWTIFVAVYHNDGGVDKQKMGQICAEIHQIRGAATQFTSAEVPKVLLLAPDTTDVDAWKVANANPRIYHLWTLSLIRLFKLLDAEVKRCGKDKVAQVFDKIFPPQDVSPISEVKIVERITQELEGLGCKKK